MTGVERIYEELLEVQNLADELGVEVFSVVMPAWDVDAPTAEMAACNTHNGDPGASMAFRVLYCLLRYCDDNGVNFEHYLHRARTLRKAVAS